MTKKSDSADDPKPDFTGIDPIYTVDEVAGFLKVQPKTVNEWIRKDLITAFRVGKNYRIRKSDLQDYIEVSYDSSGNAQLVAKNRGKDKP